MNKHIKHYLDKGREWDSADLNADF
jgi:hypothetical protein